MTKKRGYSAKLCYYGLCNYRLRSAIVNLYEINEEAPGSIIFFTQNITKSTKPFVNEHFYALNES